MANPGEAMRRGIAAVFVVLFVSSAHAMDVSVVGDQLILVGPVVGDEVPKVEKAFGDNPAIKMVVLRNSTGGDIPTGFKLGDLFRRKGLATAVSGYCFSSCSRMFLGGATRAFTDDFPPDETNVGFHGHYDHNGDLDRQLVEKTKLKAWIIKFSDGKADPMLVDRWTNIPRNIGMMHFYHPLLVKHGGASTFLCEGTEESRDDFDCEKIAKTALDLGIVTTLDLVHGNDQAAIKTTQPERPKATDFADLRDVTKVPLPPKGQEEYRRFLLAPFPRAFAIASDAKTFRWRSAPDAVAVALAGCADRGGQLCRLYAVDEDVVWSPQPN